jgi:hypothetical protein
VLNWSWRDIWRFTCNMSDKTEEVISFLEISWFERAERKV